MLKKIVRKAYNIFPFSIKCLFYDAFLYVNATKNGAVNINKIDFNKRNESVVVLGNGPSLNADRQEILSWVGKKDFVCVNNFCDDVLYTTIKPNVYIFLDAYFFSDEAHQSWVARREKTFEILNNSTEWEMTIVVPSSAKLNIITKKINNKKIKIFKFNTQPLFSSKLSCFQKWLFDTGLYGPPQINVLIYAIYLSVIAGYESIKFYGADLSFHNDVEVDQINNQLYIEFKHFNESNTVERLLKNPAKTEPWRMAELMKLTSDTFYAHEILNTYALKKGVHIENASNYSLIDAYPRSNKVIS